MCTVFSVARPHSHVASSSKYHHFCIYSLLHVNPVRIRFRHLHVVHGLSYPLTILSLRLTVTLCGVVCNLLSHSLHRIDLRREFSRFQTTQEAIPGFQPSLCRVLSIESEPHWFLVFSILAHTSLRMSGGAIPASKYRYSTLVGFRHPVTALHALFSSVFSFWAWGDLTQTCAAYSGTE